MNYRKFFPLFLLAFISSFAFLNCVFASNLEHVDEANAPTREVVKVQVPQENCIFESPEEVNYDAQVVAVRRKLKVETNEVIRVKVFMKNAGNTPWFSNKSTCGQAGMSLGTDFFRDRASSFYAEHIDGVEDTNWEAPNRIGMDQLRVNPGEIASFTFWSIAPKDPDILKEYLTPVITGTQWIDSARISYELMVGETGESPLNIRKKLMYLGSSGSAMDINLDGEQMLLVDLSDQKVFVYLDDMPIREFMVSTGKAATPTPVGETSIILKQEVRVGGEAPHYIMPKYMMFRAGGYGFHALPSLGGDGGVFWTEARSHIGIPVSHGCIRLLPEDADFLFEFTEVGARVVVQR